MIHAGSNIYVDIRDYGAYAIFSSTTCNTTNASPRVRLGAASNFKNGEYATCYNAGPATTTTTPSAPTVTPSDHAGGMTVINDSGGAKSYAYKVAAEDKFNGLSAASSAGTTSTGAATLGQTTQLNLSGCIRFNQTVTCTTTATHPFVVGQLITLTNMTDSSYNGNWITIAPTSGTTFTYLSGWSTAQGASTSGTPTNTGNVWGWKLNRVGYTTQANAFRYHIYGPNCPTTCNWMGQSVLPYWDDYGPTMMASQTRPAYIPNAAPNAAANEHFTFKINSGGGTTTLTANANAGATISSTIVSDVGPALTAAAAAQNLFGNVGCVRVPLVFVGVSTNWQVNSYTDFAGNATCLDIYGGVLVANNTLANLSKLTGTGGGSATGNFGISNQPTVVGTAYPLIYGSLIPNPLISNINITANAPNGALGIYLIAPSTMQWSNVYLTSSGGSSNDCISRQFIWRSTAGAQSFSKTINGLSGITGTCPSNSPVPTMVDMSTDTGSSSSDVIANGWFLNRMSFDNDMSGTCSPGFYVSMSNISGQNSTQPLLSISGTCSTNLGGILSVGLGEADFATPTMGIYIYGGSPWRGVIEGNAGIPNGGGNAIVGVPVENIINTSYAPPTTVGSNTNLINYLIGAVPDGFGATALVQNSEDFVLGTNYTFFTGGPSGAAPTCSTVTAGPPFTTAGTYYFSYVAVYPNGGYGPLSQVSASSCTADGTTQQINVTIPAAIPAASGYVLYRNRIPSANGFQLVTLASTCFPAKTLISVMVAPSCGPGAYTLAGGGPAGIVNGNMWAQDFILGPTVAPTGVAKQTQFYMDSTANWPSFKPNGNRAYVVPGISGPVINGHNLCAEGTSGAYVDCLTTQTIASGTVSLGTSAIEAKTCATVVTSAATGVVTADTISYSFNAAPSGAYTSGLFVQSYVTPGKVNFLICNPTTESLTPPEASLNWRVTR